MNQIYKTGDSGNIPTQTLRATSINRPIQHMNSIQMKEPEYQSSKFVDSIADGSPANKVTTAFKQNDSEMIFRGDSFQREDFESV